MPTPLSEEFERIRNCTASWCNQWGKTLAQAKESSGPNDTIAHRVPGLAQYKGNLGPIWGALKAKRFARQHSNLFQPDYVAPSSSTINNNNNNNNNPYNYAGKTNGGGSHNGVPALGMPMTSGNYVGGADMMQRSGPDRGQLTNFAGGEPANKIQISLSITAAIEGNKENNTTLINDASIYDGQKNTSPAQAPAPAPAQHVEGIDDGQKESPPVRFVECVTATNFVVGSVTEVKVYKPYADARLGIRTYDSQQGEVKILEIEDGSPMGPLLKGPLEEGMTIIAVNKEEITSSDKFKEIYNKCQVGKNVVIKVGPKKMSEALNIIEDLDGQRKHYEEKSDLLENENQQLDRDNNDLEKKNQQLVRENQRLQVQLEKERADASHFRVRARVLEMTSLD